MSSLVLIYFILSNAVATRQNTAILYSRSTCIGYLCSLFIVYTLLDFSFLNKSLSLFNGLLYCNLSTLLFVFFLLTITFLILLLTSSYPVEIKTDLHLENVSEIKTEVSVTEDLKGIGYFNLERILQIGRDHYRIIEYPLIIQFILIGSVTLLSSNDLITMFLAIELQSYGLYILCTIYRNSESSTSAGLTYFLLGGLSSCIILLGQSFLYINSGTTNLENIFLIHLIIGSNESLYSYMADVSTGISSSFFYIPTLDFYMYALQFSLVLLSVGFLFKIAASPFHSWSPGVYDAIPTVTTTFVAIVPKISILILFSDLVYSMWYTWMDYSWVNILVYSSFLSLIIGSVLGLTQFKIKRLYAYSTISHVGFILLALSVHSVESIQAFYFYIIQYSLSNLNAFIILLVIGYMYVYYQKKTTLYADESSMSVNFKKDLNNLSPIEYIDQLKGYFYLNPVLAISLSITLYSFIGIPPLVGFFAKQMILSSALDNGYVFMSLIAILTSVVSAVYYLYIVKHMFFEKSRYMVNTFLQKVTQTKGLKAVGLSSISSCLISVLTLSILLFIFFYPEIYSLINILSIVLIY